MAYTRKQIQDELAKVKCLRKMEYDSFATYFVGDGFNIYCNNDYVVFNVGNSLMQFRYKDVTGFFINHPNCHTRTLYINSYANAYTLILKRKVTE